jgi:hypothetical protein
MRESLLRAEITWISVARKNGDNLDHLAGLSVSAITWIAAPKQALLSTTTHYIRNFGRVKRGGENFLILAQMLNLLSQFAERVENIHPLTPFARMRGNG